MRPPPISTLFPYTTLFRSTPPYSRVTGPCFSSRRVSPHRRFFCACCSRPGWPPAAFRSTRSEEHTSELQSRPHLVCRLLLEKKKKTKQQTSNRMHSTEHNT